MDIDSKYPTIQVVKKEKPIDRWTLTGKNTVRRYARRVKAHFIVTQTRLIIDLRRKSMLNILLNVLRSPRIFMQCQGMSH